MIIFQILIILLIYSIESILDSNLQPFTCLNIGDDN